MSWFRLHRRSAVLVALTLALPIFLYLKVLFGVLGLAFEYRGERERVEPRAARLQGLLAQESLLLERRDAAQDALSALVYPATEDSQALAAALQAEVRQIVADAGLATTNSQVLRTRESENFDRVAVKLTVAGTLPALDAALIGIAAARPGLLLESLDVFPARSGRSAADEEQNLNAVLQVLALRVSG